MLLCPVRHSDILLHLGTFCKVRLRCEPVGDGGDTIATMATLLKGTPKLVKGTFFGIAPKKWVKVGQPFFLSRLRPSRLVHSSMKIGSRNGLIARPHQLPLPNRKIAPKWCHSAQTIGEQILSKRMYEGAIPRTQIQVFFLANAILTPCCRTKTQTLRTP